MKKTGEEILKAQENKMKEAIESKLLALNFKAYTERKLKGEVPCLVLLMVWKPSFRR